MASYTFHFEYTDGTFDEKPFHTVSNKRKALRIAKLCAKEATPVAQRIIVQDEDGLTVQAFPLPIFKSLEG